MVLGKLPVEAHVRACCFVRLFLKEANKPV
jgi:hypothetical protein